MVSAARAFAVKSPLTAVGGVVGLVVCLVAGVIFLSTAGDDLSEGAKMIVITTLMANVFTVIPSILNLYKTESVSHDLHNGVVKQKVKEAITEVAEDTDADGTYLPKKREGDPHG